MAGNPRKFSEKIALHMQKQAEESAAFEQIMKSVSDVKPNTTNATTTQHLSITPLLNQRHGGSLPNVNVMTQQHGEKGHASRASPFNQSSSPRGSRQSIGPVRGRDRMTRAADHSPYNSPTSVLSSSIPSGQTGGFSSSNLPTFFPNNYLSLPENAGCRRFNSDSALHNMLIPSTVPHSSEESSNNSNDPYDLYLNQNSAGSNRTSPHQHDSPGGRALSGSGDGSAYLEIPQNSSPLTGSGASAGSLPDLTNAPFNFQSPMQPLDLEEHQQLNHSPYSTSPVYSPSNLSSSPLGTSGVLQRSQQPSAQQQQQARSPTNPQMHNNPLYVNIISATNNSFQQSFPQDSNMWRNPQRPSPQSSPNPYQSPSPHEGGGQWSAPSSPSGQQGAPSQSDFYLSQQHQLQHQFENITVADRDRNSGSWHQGASQYYSNPNQAQLGEGAAAGGTQTSPNHQQQQPQTPQTPSSIPEIILSEFLGPDYSELRASDFEGLFREGLGPLDLEAFQILNETDPHDPLQLDPNDEESFRLDRL